MTDSPAPSDTRDAPPDWDAIARFLAGESGADEARDVAAWLAAHPGDAEVVRRVDAHATAALAPAADAPPIDVEGALARVRARREGADVLPLRSAPPRRRMGWGLGGLAAAAAVAAIAVGIGTRGRATDAARDTTGVGASPAGARVVTTAVGQRDSVRLPDGSRVVLAPGSRLTIAAGYGDRARDVQLDGAAWFAVRHDEARPFAVRAGNAVVRDLGTEFTVRTDGAGNARSVAVVVTEGVVSLRAARADADSGVVLQAGDRGALAPDGATTAERGAATEDDVAWTRGRLVYRAAPLDVVRADLRRWYGLELRVDDPTLAARRLTATFEGEPAARVVEVVALALGARATQVGDTVVLGAAAR
jgi:transmembrane sensor